MCGRFALGVPPYTIEEFFNIDRLVDYTPSYNIAPTRMVPGIINSDGSRVMDMYRWGLIPSWAKDERIGARLINARAETIADKPSFRVAFRSRRCLIPATGFYEWMKLADGKQPYYISLRNDAPFAFAGLWESWKPEDGRDSVESCTIITTEPNEMMARIHSRMPVILAMEDYNSWLGFEHADRKTLTSLLVPYPAGEMKMHPVSRRVNSPVYDSPDATEPDTASPAGG